MLKNFYKYRGLLMIPPVSFAFFCKCGEFENHIIFVIGGFFFGIGVIIRLWAQIYLHNRLKFRTDLTTGGPYKYVRNPLYIGNTLILIGFVMLCELFWFAPVMFAWCIFVYSKVVHEEEKHLSKKYGQLYEDYRKSVPAWIPKHLPVRLSLVLAPQRQFVLPSLIAESSCLLLLIPAIVKELMF